MKIYIHKVKMNPIDGWGRSIGMSTEVLGTYKTLESAAESKKQRDSSSDSCYCDVGSSWIEENEVKE